MNRATERKNPFATLAAWLTLALAPVIVATVTAAQAETPAPTGRIHGRILQVETGQYLNNVRVTVMNTGIETFTDQTGTYRLAGSRPETWCWRYSILDCDPRRRF